MSETPLRIGLLLGSAAATLLPETPPNLVVVRRHHPAYLGPDVAFIPAHRVDHEENLRHLLDAGCTHVLSINSVGSLRQEIPVGSVVAPDDFYAPAVNPSIHDDIAGHSVPGFHTGWRATVIEVWNRLETKQMHDGGVYAQTRGPRFETPAEVKVLALVAHIVGMTVASECILARELGLPYAAVCMVDNLGNGLAPSGADLTLDDYETGKAANQLLLASAIPRLLDALVSDHVAQSTEEPH